VAPSLSIVDPSALIFVALAVAWAVYLIPKALEHHEEGARTRTVERFSATLRVLARREPINRRKARLVAGTATAASTSTSTSTSTSSTTVVTTERTSSRRPPAAEPLTASQLRARRRAAAKAARRRLRVVSLILIGNAVVAALAYLKVLDWVWCAVPVGVLVVWLVACRVMVRRERAELPQARIPAETPSESPAESPRGATGEIATVDAPLLGAEPVRDPDAWDPVYAPLPTYVSKPAAPRSVSTIDLDSTGVWSSGHNASDSKLAREAEAVERSSSPGSAERRASGA
jgi:hypothetical protein